jgi:hypothetical protein
MPETHEPCGNGHMAPIGQECGICAALEHARKKEAEGNTGK